MMMLHRICLIAFIGLAAGKQAEDSEFALDSALKESIHLRGGPDRVLVDGLGDPGALSTSYSETSYKNVFQKEADSFSDLLVGLILICLTPCLLAWNEKRHVYALKRLMHVSAETKDANSDNPSAADNRELVHLTGVITTDNAVLSDSVFPAIQSKGAFGIRRATEIYQYTIKKETKKEKTTFGGEEKKTTTRIVEKWCAQPVGDLKDSHFKQKNNNGNWDKLAPPNSSKWAESGRMGKIEISQSFLREQLADFKPIADGPAKISVDGVTFTKRGSEGYVDYSGASPPIGACRIKFTQASGNVKCSVIGEQCDASGTKQGPTGETLQYGIKAHTIIGCGICIPNSNLGEVLICYPGTFSTPELVKMEQNSEFVMVCVVRLVGYVLLMVGWGCIFSPITNLLGAIPFFGAFANFGIGLVAMIVGCTCASTIISIAYLVVHPLLTTCMLGIIAGIVYGLHYLALKDGGAAAAHQYSH